MMSSGSDLLSARASVVWLAALAGVVIFHCGHVISMRGQYRWYHVSHIVMLLGMLYMYAAVAFGVDLLPADVWLIIYVATSVVIVGWMLLRLAQRRSLGYLWVLALAQQVAMIYMWMPMRDWIPWLSYALAGYFTLETIAWLTRLRNKPAASCSCANAGAARSMVMNLEQRSAAGSICMSIMAASMAYMFVGMQLMMMPTQPLPEARQQQPAPTQVAGKSSHSGSNMQASAQAPKVAAHGPVRPSAEAPTPPPCGGSGAQAPAQAPKVVVHEPAGRSVKASPPLRAKSYTISAGDSLRGIAIRLYRDARQWRSIMKANPGLNPRRLRVGHVISLPIAP
jgi:hypothetical protein